MFEVALDYLARRRARLRAMLSFSDAAAPEAPGDPRLLAGYGSFETTSSTSDDERETLDSVSGIDGASSDGEPDGSDDDGGFELAARRARERARA